MASPAEKIRTAGMANDTHSVVVHVSPQCATISFYFNLATGDWTEVPHRWLEPAADVEYQDPTPQSTEGSIKHPSLGYQGISFPVPCGTEPPSA